MRKIKKMGALITAAALTVTLIGTGAQRRPLNRGPAAGRDHPAAGRAAEIPGGRSEPDHQTGVCPPAYPPGDGRSGGDRPSGGERGAQRRSAGAV